MSQKNTGRNVGGFLLTDADIARIDQQVSTHKGVPGGNLEQDRAVFRRGLQLKADQDNRSRRGFNRLVRFGQIASVAPLGMAFAPGGIAAAGGLGGGGAAAAEAASVPGVVAGSAAPLGVGTVEATLPVTGSMMSSLAPYAANTASMMTPAQAMSIAAGTGSAGAQEGIRRAAGGGNTMNNLLKIGELGVGAGSGLWASHVQSEADKRALAAQERNQASLLAWEKEVDTRNRADYAQTEAENKRRWEQEQQNVAYDRDVERLMWEDKEARRAPYRTAGYNALAHLNNINGLPIPAAPAPRSLPAYMSSLTNYRG